MTIGKDSVGDMIQLNGEEIEEVEDNKYLGVKIHKIQNGNNDAEINERIESTTKLYYAIVNNFIRKKEIIETKIMVCNTE
nr:unnamed protein product [Callosobruchus analis]